eukprot:COSAG06_NODE_2017_length_7839_cov_128.027003_7_plen_80_part_00
MRNEQRDRDQMKDTLRERERECVSLTLQITLESDRVLAGPVAGLEAALGTVERSRVALAVDLVVPAAEKSEASLDEHHG